MTAPAGEGVDTPEPERVGMETYGAWTRLAVFSGVPVLMAQTIPPSVVGSLVGIVGTTVGWAILMHSPDSPARRLVWVGRRKS